LTATAFFATPGPRFEMAFLAATAFFRGLTDEARPDTCPDCQWCRSSLTLHLLEEAG
jgi:hypothetical protein